MILIRAVRARIHALARHLAVEHNRPFQLALAVFVGCVVGCTPLFGFHLLLCVLLAIVLRLNKVVMYAAANLSIPPFIPFIGYASIQLGERLRHGHFLSLTPDEITWKNAHEIAQRFFVDWMVGGLVVGAGAGLIAAPWVLLWSSARRRRRLVEADPIVRAIEDARRRYDGLPGKYKWYARMKYRMDPCYRAICAHVAPGEAVVDLGTGLGMLPVVLGVLGEDRRALGIEWDVGKVKAGLHAAQGLVNVRIEEGDVHAHEIPPCDIVTLVDVLHYYDAAQQRALLSRAAVALGATGRILIREGDADRSGSAKWTRAVEAVVTRLGWNRGPRVRFRPIAELSADLEALGFTVAIESVAGELHPGNVLVVAARAKVTS